MSPGPRHPSGLRLAYRAAPVLCIGAVLACRPGAGEPPSQWDGPAALAWSGDTVVLSDAHPRFAQTIDLVSIPEGVIAAEVPVVRIDNEALVSFSIRVRLLWGDRPAESADGEGVLLGEFTAYPPDRTGRYLLGVPREVALVRAGPTNSGTRATLVFEMRPLPEGKPLGSPLRVFIAPVEWRVR